VRWVDLIVYGSLALLGLATVQRMLTLQPDGLERS